MEPLTSGLGDLQQPHRKEAGRWGAAHRGDPGGRPPEPKDTPSRAAFRPAFVHRSPRILVAEDDDEMRRLVAEALRKDGYDVLAISDGRRLLGALAGDMLDGRSEGLWDLVVSDVRMPGPSGLQILQEVRAAHWRVPFILMTAFGDASMHEQARALGAVLFDKPFDVTKLRTAVASLLWRGP